MEEKNGHLGGKHEEITMTTMSHTFLY